jgi:hypothetical protein
MYRYYRRRMAPKVDVRLVIAITLTIISAVQVIRVHFLRLDLNNMHIPLSTKLLLAH